VRLQHVQVVVDFLASQPNPRGQRRRRGGHDQLGEESTPHGLQSHRRRCRIIDDLDVEHEERVVLTTFIVNDGFKAFSDEFAESMSCRRIRSTHLQSCRLAIRATTAGARRFQRFRSLFHAQQHPPRHDERGWFHDAHE
jgi:hypothetical protein